MRITVYKSPNELATAGCFEVVEHSYIIDGRDIPINVSIERSISAAALGESL